jgi:hypothetical protein
MQADKTREAGGQLRTETEAGVPGAEEQVETCEWTWRSLRAINEDRRQGS